MIIFFFLDLFLSIHCFSLFICEGKVDAFWINCTWLTWQTPSMGLKSADKPPFNRLTPHLASKAHWGVPEDGWRQVPSETAGCLSLLCSRSEKGRVLIRACLPARGDYSRTMPHFPFQNNRPARLTSVTANVSLWRWHMHTHSQEQQSGGRPHSIVSVLCKCVFWVYSAHFSLHSLHDTHCLICFSEALSLKGHT